RACDPLLEGGRPAGPSARRKRSAQGSGVGAWIAAGITTAPAPIYANGMNCENAAPSERAVAGLRRLTSAAGAARRVLLPCRRGAHPGGTRHASAAGAA